MHGAVGISAVHGGEDVKLLCTPIRCGSWRSFLGGRAKASSPQGRLDCREDFICWHELYRPIVDFSRTSLDFVEPGGVYVRVPWPVQLFPKLAEQGLLLRIAEFADFLLNMREGTRHARHASRRFFSVQRR